MELISPETNVGAIATLIQLIRQGPRWETVHIENRTMPVPLKALLQWLPLKPRGVERSKFQGGASGLTVWAGGEASAYERFADK
jgi:hypothetical protein